MPKHVPAEFTGRFSIKPKQSSSRLRTTAPTPPFDDPSTSPIGAFLVDNFREDALTLLERKRKKDEDWSTSGGPSSGASPSQDADDELEQYSSRLEVQSPVFNQYSHQGAVRRESAGQYFAPEIGALRLQHRSRSRVEAELPTNRDKVLQIISSAWTRPGGIRPDVSSAAHRLTHLIYTASRSQDARELSQIVVSTSIGFASNQPQSFDFVISVLDEAAKLLLIREAPGGVAAGGPATVPIAPRTCAEAVSSYLKQYYDQTSDSLCTFAERSSSTGSPKRADQRELDERSGSNLRSPRAKADVDDALYQVQWLRKERKNHVLSTGMLARFFSLGVIQPDDRGEKGEADEDADSGSGESQRKRRRQQQPATKEQEKYHHQEELSQPQGPPPVFLFLIRAGLDRKQPSWSQMNMIRACILLRGCAWSLLSYRPGVPDSTIPRALEKSTGKETAEQSEQTKTQEQGRRQQEPLRDDVLHRTWRTALEGFLLQDDNETGDDNDHFVMKSHAAVCRPSSSLLLDHLSCGAYDFICIPRTAKPDKEGNVFLLFIHFFPSPLKPFIPLEGK